jgi:ribosomal protein S12 methylthiotransferase
MPRPAPKPTASASNAKPAGAAPKIGIVSLGCPKALVDSERIITKLRSEGYELSATYAGADAVVVNTCGFLNSAKEESLAAIGEALAENGKVIVTGCLGVEQDRILARHLRRLQQCLQLLHHPRAARQAREPSPR